MDCSICTTMPFILRPPRNTICAGCYEAARNVLSLMNKLECDHSNNYKAIDQSNSNKAINGGSSLVSTPTSCKPQPLANLPKWMNSMKEAEDELNDKINFLSGFVGLFRDQILTDIQLKPCNDGPPIPAHRAILAARSEIFKNMLDSDSCKAAPANDSTITLPELNHEELISLLEFLYSGSLSTEKLENHVYSLTLAADKYEIPYLEKFCERHMLASLNSSNALEVLEISDVCSNKTLKEAALSFIVKSMEDVAFSARFEVFASKNPHLCVQITRVFLMDSKNRRGGI
ncbi:BTB/POZ domain-containing protein At3g56230 [Rutidosis leptorrhynchoides]|uniref:BTB/POZ domain-containing protein At3g56230 n=1 Tax=Rutidosis leptorrhynchoides TaxID=125765 RepID=UPI003A9A392C